MTEPTETFEWVGRATLHLVEASEKTHFRRAWVPASRMYPHVYELGGGVFWAQVHPALRGGKADTMEAAVWNAEMAVIDMLPQLDPGRVVRQVEELVASEEYQGMNDVLRLKKLLEVVCERS